ncbi:SecY-interacting protein Syd [Priestia megaterium]|nr:SecY-interacting protein Syd [Priestia megaterium]
MKDAMSNYFKVRREYFEKGLDFLFKTTYNENVQSMIYQGEVDEDEEILWNPVQKNNHSDIKPLEERFHITFHSSIDCYFNSYWFAELDGFLDSHYITLEAVLPNVELDTFERNLKGYKINHNKLDKVPIGIEGNGLVVVIDNLSGKIELEDFERGCLKEIAKSLEDLISSLRLQR